MRHLRLLYEKKQYTDHIVARLHIHIYILSCLIRVIIECYFFLVFYLDETDTHNVNNEN
jgi:hypothetical protein